MNLLEEYKHNMKKGTQIALSDKREIQLNDDNDILLSIISDGETVHSFPVPYPSAGYGGGTLLLSSSEQYLLFSYYSGQSEEAYSLFKIDNCYLKLIYESGYLYGEGASYMFFGNENFLVQALPKSLGPWYIEDAGKDADGNAFFEYGEINILDMNTMALNKHTFCVYPSENWNDNMAEKEAFYISNIEDDHILHFMMPWGEVKLTLPLNQIITLEVK